MLPKNPFGAGLPAVGAFAGFAWSMMVVAVTDVPLTVPWTTIESPTATFEIVPVVLPVTIFAFVASTVYVTLLLFVMVMLVPFTAVTLPAVTGSPLPVNAGVDVAPLPNCPGAPVRVVGTTPSRIIVATRFVPVSVPCAITVSPTTIAESELVALFFITVAFVASTV